MRTLLSLTGALLGMVLVPSGGTRLRGDFTEVENHVYLRPGDRAPVFEGIDDHGHWWKSSDHVGRKAVVVYFYLGDFMKGCTDEAKAFQRNLEKFRKAGAEVVGISGDEPGNHRLFKKTYRLGYTLLADPRGLIGKRFGIALSGGGQLRIRDSEGRTITLTRGVTAPRWLFVIGVNGRILLRDTNVRADESIRRVLAVLARSKKGAS